MQLLCVFAFMAAGAHVVLGVTHASIDARECSTLMNGVCQVTRWTVLDAFSKIREQRWLQIHPRSVNSFLERSFLASH